MRLALGLLCALGVLSCGADDETQIHLILPSTTDLQCGTTVPTNLTVTLYVSGNIPPCDLVVTNGEARGSCANIPTGIERSLLLRYAVPDGIRTAPLRYALTRVDLTATHLAETGDALTVTFADNGVAGMYVDTDADVAQLRDLLYGPRTMLSGAICFARSVIATDAGTPDVVADCMAGDPVAPVLDLDADGCTNLRELCDGTPIGVDSGTTCVN